MDNTSQNPNTNIKTQPPHMPKLIYASPSELSPMEVPSLNRIPEYFLNISLFPAVSLLGAMILGRKAASSN